MNLDNLAHSNSIYSVQNQSQIIRTLKPKIKNLKICHSYMRKDWR